MIRRELRDRRFPCALQHLKLGYPIGIGGYALQLEERSKDLCGKLFLTLLWSGFWLHRLQRCDPAETSPPRTGGVLQERDNVLFVHTGGLFAQDWEV